MDFQNLFKHVIIKYMYMYIISKTGLKDSMTF